MHKYLLLTGVLLKNINFSFTMTGLKEKKNLKNLVLGGVILLSLLPMVVAIGAGIFAAYDVLAQIQQEGIILAMGLSAVSLAIFFFGILYIVNVFYFSRDIENLLPLPLRPAEILGAKFTVSLLYEYLTEALFLAPILIAFGIKSHGGVLYYLYALLVFLVLPIVPLIYAAIISMVIMRFTNIGRHKDRFKIIGGVVAMFAALGINMLIQRWTSSALKPEQLQQLLQQGNNSAMNMLGQFFPQNKYAALALLHQGDWAGISNLLFYLVLVVVFIWLFLFVGERLYFQGVIGVSESAAARKKLSPSAYGREMSQKPILFSLVRRELSILFRTPVYFMNCIVMNFLWPAFLLLPMIFQPKAFDQLKTLADYARDDQYAGIVLAAAFAIGLFVSAANLITATAISREGKNIIISKYLPVQYRTQILAKVISGMFMGMVAMVMMVLVAGIFVALPAALWLMMVVVSLLGIGFSSLSGIIIDLYFPKLLWDNETKAVKQNMNGVINIFLCAAVAGLAVYLVVIFHLPLWTVLTGLVIIFGLLDTLLYLLLATVGSRLFKGIEI